MTEIGITGFEMIEKLGEGGMAVVWKARQISLDRIVAIKMLSPRLATDSSDIQRFQAEAQSAAKLKHQGIVQVYDANVENGIYYFVMEYVAGYTVGDWVRRKRILSEKDALLVAECVSDGLDYAWNKERIIHCDIKPDNVIIDSDGTVKLADLGLARTISSMSAESTPDEIMGTPSYISPEQATGEPDLDFRADIYSLGAMLYHLVTGNMLFQGEPDGRVMEMQVNDTVEDPLTVNPKLSKAICWLIEKMLAKEKNARQSDWKSVRQDIARVKKKLMPKGSMPVDGLSTVRRSRQRTKTDYVHTTPPKKKVVPPPTRPLVAVGLFVIIVLGAYEMHQLNMMPGPTDPSPVNQVPAAPTPKPLTDHNAREMYEFAEKWAMENPEKYQVAIKRFHTVAKQTQGTKYALMAEDEISRLTRSRQQDVRKVLRSLQEETAYYVKRKKFDEAANLYEQYTGLLADETKVQRMEIAKALRERKTRLEEARRTKKTLVEKKLHAVLEHVVSKLIAEGPVSALTIVEEALSDDDLFYKQTDLKTIENLLYDSANINNRILDSFEAQKGSKITVHLADGKKKIIIKDVKEGRVFGKQESNVGYAVMSISFEPDDLDRREKLLRMGSDDLPEVALVKGLIAFQSKAFTYAKKYFEKTHSILADRLVARVENILQQQSNL